MRPGTSKTNHLRGANAIQSKTTERCRRHFLRSARARATAPGLRVRRGAHPAGRRLRTGEHPGRAGGGRHGHFAAGDGQRQPKRIAIGLADDHVNAGAQRDKHSHPHCDATPFSHGDGHGHPLANGDSHTQQDGHTPATSADDNANASAADASARATTRTLSAVNGVCDLYWILQFQLHGASARFD
jgi:hypothetical protein